MRRGEGLAQGTRASGGRAARVGILIALSVAGVDARAGVAPGDRVGPGQGSLYLVAEPVVLARVIEVKVKGTGFVPVSQPATQTPTAVPGTPGPYELLSQVSIGKDDGGPEMVPVYSAQLHVSVLKVLEDGRLQRGLLPAGTELTVTTEGMPRQPEYQPQNVVRLRLRLHCDRKDPQKASYRLWQLVEASPPLSPDAVATFEPPFHLHRVDGDYDRQVAIARGFVRAVATWVTYEGLAVSGVGTVHAEEKGGAFLCFVGKESVKRGTLWLGTTTVSTQDLHDFAFHDKNSLSDEAVGKLYLVWRHLKGAGALDEK